VGGPPSGERRLSDRKLALVANPAAAGGRPFRLMPQVRAELDSLALPHRVIEARDMEHAVSAAAEAASAGELVVAMGGDGLVGALAGAVRGKGPVGVIPAGRGNDFARELGIPVEIEAACRVLAEGEERAIDLGLANERPFVCIASTGFDSDANRIANDARLIKGNLVYLYGALRALWAWRPTRFTVCLDGDERRFEGYTVAVANTRFYGGGMRVAPSAKPADGQLDVVLVEQNSKFRFLANLPKVFSGSHIDVEGVRSFRAREVEISADRAFDVYADGDRITSLPATVRVEPGVLRVIAPR
jgi:YegS/Rv2252/BmrU family lipid kinase